MIKPIILLLALFSMQVLAGNNEVATSEIRQNEAKKVVIFSATYCPNCLHVKKYLSTKDIPYLEFDIEKSPSARKYFDKLGGRGTPFLLVNNHPMQGFSEKAFWHYYTRAK